MSFISYLMSHEWLKGAGFVAEFTGDFGFLSAVISLICCNHVCQRNLFSCNLSCATSWIGASALVRCRCTYLSPAKKGHIIVRLQVRRSATTLLDMTLWSCKWNCLHQCITGFDIITKCFHFFSGRGRRNKDLCIGIFLRLRKYHFCAAESRLLGVLRWKSRFV